MADLQATIAKLSLEKYSGVVSVLSQGGDAAGLVTDIGSLKEVAKLNGLEGRAKTTKVDLAQMLCTCRLGSTYIRSQDASSQDAIHKECEEPLVALQPNDLIGLRWAVPSQALVNGIATAPTLIDFAQSTSNVTAARAAVATTGGVPTIHSVQQQVPLNNIRNVVQVFEHAGQPAKPYTLPQGASQQVHPAAGVENPTHMPALAVEQTQVHSTQVSQAVRSHLVSEGTHSQPAHTQITSHTDQTLQRAGQQIQEHRRYAPQPSHPLTQAPELQQSQKQPPRVACSREKLPTAQPPITAAPVAAPTPGFQTQSQPPGWLVQDMLELARSSSVAPVHPDTCILKQRIGICFPEDHELSSGRKGKTVVKKGVYDGKVLKVLEDTEHDENACMPGCCLNHSFCTVKLSVPNLETRSQTLVEVCVDLPTRLQLGSFAEFAQGDKLEDAWVLLVAGQSPELPALSQLLAQGTTTTSSQPARSGTRAPSKTIPKVPAGVATCKMPPAPLKMAVRLLCSTVQPQPTRPALHVTTRNDTVPLVNISKMPPSVPGAHNSDTTAAAVPRQAPSTVLPSGTGRPITQLVDSFGANEGTGHVKCVGRQALHGHQVGSIQGEASVIPDSQTVKPAVQGQHQTKSGNGWKKRKRLGTGC